MFREVHERVNADMGRTYPSKEIEPSTTQRGKMAIGRNCEEVMKRKNPYYVRGENSIGGGIYYKTKGGKSISLQRGKQRGRM